ncbi:MAG: cob(I)yrinic acid a,c-diamide adenosyltransferase [Clostridiales bacterium]|nr:cob(I)yrinic acid a,c-diamide adenosyltransferase [Clostridiales bacterium]
MVHIYCGDGKGKTTAAMGLALRGAGRGLGVVVAQFLKGEDTGERRALAHVPGVVLLPLPEQVKFSFQMDEADRREAAERFAALCDQCQELAAAREARMVILDEVCAAVNTGLLPLERVLALLDAVPPETEMVLTGRDPHPALLDRADYVTEMKKIRHPYEKGVRARIGIEF